VKPIPKRSLGVFLRLGRSRLRHREILYTGIERRGDRGRTLGERLFLILVLIQPSFTAATAATAEP
jgi:hypothetical protein